MTTEGSQTKPEVTHDFLADWRWLSYIAGFSESSTVLYTTYKAAIIIVILYLQLSAVWACVLDPSKKMIVNALHFMLVGVIGLACIAMRIFVYRSLDKTRNVLNAGVYCYEHEEEDSGLMKIKESIPVEVRRGANIYILAIYQGAAIYTTLFPLSQLLFLNVESPSESDVINPYLPHIFYQPYDTRSTTGMIAGYLLGLVYYAVCLYGAIAMGMSYYVSGVVQMKLHFRILNYSIRNVERRAREMHSRIAGPTASRNFRALLEDKTFHECLYMCFRSNVQHHQELLKLRRLFEPYSGLFALILLSLASLVYGCLLYLMLQDNAINVTLYLCFWFIAEQSGSIYISFFGEELFQEGEKVFHQLYDISWFNYSKKFKKILHIAMSNTIQPPGVKTLLFGVPASFETYGQILSAMYKILNLVRQSDIV